LWPFLLPPHSRMKVTSNVTRYSVILPLSTLPLSEITLKPVTPRSVFVARFNPSSAACWNPSVDAAVTLCDRHDQSPLCVLQSRDDPPIEGAASHAARNAAFAFVEAIGHPAARGHVILPSRSVSSATARAGAVHPDGGFILLKRTGKVLCEGFSTASFRECTDGASRS